MEEFIKGNLKEEEDLLWYGRSASEKVVNNTYRMPYILKFVISYGLAILLIIYATAHTGGVRPSVVVIMLIFGSIAPWSALADGNRSRKLAYAVTNKRLIRVNGPQFISAEFDAVSAAALRKDADGFTSLLVGEKAVTSRPSRWRGWSVFNVAEKNNKEFIDRYVFYAVDDVAGLKKALQGRLAYTEG